MTPDVIYADIARRLTESGVDASLITPEARLEEELNLDWMDVDNLFSDLGGWSDWHTQDRFPEDALLDYFSVYRGLDRHFLSPYRERDERARIRFVGHGVPQSADSLILEPLTVADVMRFVREKRYVCPTPLAGIESIVTRTFGEFSRNRKHRVALDSRLGEELKFVWRTLNKALVSIDQELGGAFYWDYRGRTWNKALLYWHAMEALAGTPSLRVNDLLTTVRENRWVGPIEIDWRASIPALRERRPLSEEEISLTIKWLLVERGWLPSWISPYRALKWDRDVVKVLTQLEHMLAGEFSFTTVIRDKVIFKPRYCTLRVADLVPIVRANRWVEPKRWRWLKRLS